MSWWIERSSPQQTRSRELFSVKDFHPCSYEETYEAWKVEQEGSCYLVMAWYWRSRIFRGKGEEIRQWNAKQIHPENDANSNAKLRKAKTQAERNVRQEVDPSEKYLLMAGCSSDSVTLIIKLQDGCKGQRLEITSHKMLVTIPIKRLQTDMTATSVVGCSWKLRFTKAPRRKILQKCWRALIRNATEQKQVTLRTKDSAINFKILQAPR